MKKNFRNFFQFRILDFEILTFTILFIFEKINFVIWNIFNIFRLFWYGFFSLLAWWWGQPGHGKAWQGKGAGGVSLGGMSHWVFPESKSIMWLMQYPQEVMQCQKHLADVLGPINREPSSHSLQLLGCITAVWITAKRKMESHYVCCVCDTSFSTHKEIHGQETR